MHLMDFSTQPDLPASTPLHRLRTMASWFYTALALIAIIWNRLRTGHWLPDSLTTENLLPSLVLGAALGFATVFISDRLTRRWSAMRNLAWELHRIVGRVDPCAAFHLALFSAVGEELFFRAAMQPAIGYILTSLIFGLIHTGPNRHFRAWTLSAIVMGFALGAIVLVTENLYGAILAHFLINFINLQQIGKLPGNHFPNALTPDTSASDTPNNPSDTIDSATIDHTHLE